MRYVYEMSALRIYSSMERKSYYEMSRMIGISNMTLSRYVSGERLPDINTLVRICNMLRVSVSNFIHHPDVEMSTIEVFMEEEWHPVKFRANRLEVFRMDKGIDKNTFLDQVRKETGITTTLATYNRLKNEENSGHEFVIGFLNTYEIELDYLFEDVQINMKNQSPNGDILISRQTLIDMKKRMKELEDENKILYTKCRRLERREQARVYSGNDPHEQADKRIRKFIVQTERALADLKSYLPDELVSDNYNENIEKQVETMKE